MNKDLSHQREVLLALGSVLSGPAPVEFALSVQRPFRN